MVHIKKKSDFHGHEMTFAFIFLWLCLCVTCKRVFIKQCIIKSLRHNTLQRAYENDNDYS